LRSDAPRDRAASRKAYALLAAGAGLEGKAAVSGRLYAPDWYPALRTGSGGIVKGEVWRIEDAGLLARLDAYEGQAYVRETLQAVMKDGRRVTAWSYRHVSNLIGVPLIASGDYLDWVRTR
jgi:gamma-glutamylcyclotransferase (GGCT)/AIG2-like uncharacterized protein YtfP